eukprot:5042533-Pyramimonas_sp.AAC.1
MRLGRPPSPSAPPGARAPLNRALTTPCGASVGVRGRHTLFGGLGSCSRDGLGSRGLRGFNTSR